MSNQRYTDRPVTVYSFSYQDVEYYLFGQRRNTELHSSTADQSHILVDIPDIVCICVSTIPGANYGIQATQVIPEGAWIGPYKGKIISADKGLKGLETSCLWEIYKDGRLHTYVDGNDEQSCSWMKYIQCARNKHEQNLYAFQYREKIYYRVYKTVYPGQELLVWYDDLYTQYLGIPCHGVYDMASVKGATKFPGNLVVFAQEDCLPVTPPSSPARSLPDAGPVRTPPDPCPVKSLPDTSPGRSPPDTCPVRSLPDIYPARSLPDTGPAKSLPDTGPVWPLPDTGPARSLPDTGHVTSLQSTNSCSKRDSQSSPQDSSEQCGQCKKRFTQRGLLQTHICTSITKKPYQCGHCDERFSNPGEMTVHVAIHQDRKPFKCGYCSRSFTGATTLNNHVRMHTGEKVFDCNRCGKTFIKGLQLSRHIKTCIKTV